MNALLTGIEHPLAIHAGWMALSILWLSSGVAVLLALWRASMPTASAEAQHRAAVIALVACLLGPAIPYVSRAIASTQPTSVRVVAPAPHVTPTQPLQSISSTSGTPVVRLPSGRTVAGSAGALWLAGSTLLWLRLVGGWWVALGVRRRAMPLQSPEADDMVQRHATELDLSTPLQLLQSPEIEAPVVIGVRRPALIMPDDLAQQLGPEALSPLIAHELAHVKRRDYAVNMVQSVLDALLFFSPGVLWVSHTLREAREFCCDDLSVDACGGDRGRYVRVLTSMASLGSRHRRQPVLGAAGPRLLTRVRRLLKDGNRIEVSRVALAACGASFIAFVITTPTIVRATAVGTALPLSAHVQGGETTLPISWVTRQVGSPVTVKAVSASPDHLGLRATVQNNTDTAIERLQFAAAVAKRDGGDRIRLFVGQLLDIELGPAQATELGIDCSHPK